MKNRPVALDSQAPTRRRYVVLAFLGVLAFLTYFDRIGINRAKPDIQDDLAITPDQMALILGAFWFAYALFEIPGGWLSDRYGARVMLARIVLAWSLFTFLSGCAAGFLSLLLCRFLFGVGEAGAFPTMARVQSRWLPAHAHARAGGLIWLLARWGGAFAPLGFGMLSRFFDAPAMRSLLAAFGLSCGLHGWRAPFWVAGLLGAVWCAAFYPWFRDDPAQSTANAAELRLIGTRASAPARSHPMPAAAWRALFLSPNLWALALVYVCGSFAWSFFITWMPDYLKAVHNVAYEQSEWMTGLPLFCGGISCLVGGVLSDALVRRTGPSWFGRALFPLCGYTTAAVAMLWVRFAGSAEEAAVLMCIASAGHDFGQGANWATIVDVGGRYAGTSTGFINLVGNAGNYLQPSIGRLLQRSFGWNVLLTCYSAAFLLAAAMWLFINPRRTFWDERPPAS